MAFVTSQLFVNGQITPTGSLTTARIGHESQVLPNGNVMAMGGDNYTLSNFATYKTCEIYNTTSGTWSAGISMKDTRSYFSSVTLNNGKILVMGGAVGDYYSGTPYIRKSCELYDPVTNTWAYTDSMQAGHIGHFAVKLNNGKVLIGGGNLGSTACQLYDPATGLWSATGSLAITREHQDIVLLANGNALISGGYVNTAEVYNANTGTWSSGGTMSTIHNFHSSILLNNQKVLIAGGGSPTCELYDPNTNTFTTTGTMSHERNRCPEVLLSNGNALSFGLADFFSPTNTKCIETYNPTLGTWSTATYTTGSNFGVNGYTIHKLSNGNILIIGGTFTSGNGASKGCFLVSGSSSTGINVLQSSSLLTFFPNPAKDYITIDVALIEKESECVIYAADGSEKIHTVLQNDKLIDIKQLSSGIYFICLKNGSDMMSAKFIKE